MLKKITTLAAFAVAFGLAAANAHANTIAGRVTSFTPTSITVLDKEAVTTALNRDTAFTKLIVRKPWQENTQLTFNALALGRYVVVHASNGVATWVQVNTDETFFVKDAFTSVIAPVVPPGFMTEAARHRAEAAALRKAANASESKRPGSPGTAAHCDRIAARLEAEAGGVPAYAGPAASAVAPAAIAQATAGDILTSKEVQALIANAKTPADHLKLAKHYAAVAARYDAEAADHAAEAVAYRKAPNASESKRPGHPGTAAHCDSFADAARAAAKAARDLARDHEQMAK